MNVGVVLPNWIGDVVMATPTLRALQRHFGSSAQLVGVMRPHAAEVLAGTDLIQTIVLYDPKSPRRHMHTWSVARQLRRMDVELMVLLTNNLRAALLAVMSGASQRVGYVRRGRGWMLNTKLYPPRESGQLEPISAVDYYLQLAYALGAPQDTGVPVLSTSVADDRTVATAFAKLKIPQEASIAVLNTGGAYGAAKHWPSSYFAQLASQIADECDQHVVVMCGPSERREADSIAKASGHPHVHSLAEFPPSIGFSKAVVRRANTMVTTDSGPRHFAHAFEVPVLTLFGPTDPRWSETRHPLSIHVREPMECSPCARRVCPLGHHRCMVDMTSDRVFREYLQLRSLAGTRRSAA